MFSIKLSTSYLLPGMKLERALYGRSGELLLKKRAVLTARNIMALRRAGILAVNVANSGFKSERRDKLEDEVRLYAMNAVQDWAHNAKNENLATLLQSVEVIIDEILAGKEVVGGLAEICSVDMYTYAHSVDVCVLAIAIGCKLNLHRKKLTCLGVGSILHDLGKTRVPTELLNKPGKLSPGEFNEIKKHPAYGYEIVQQSNLSRSSMEIILNHHERYDGAGYPRGLKGDKVGELAYICAVADVYNAMTTDRAYRKALPPHEAYEMIMASSESMFDPAVVVGFLQCVIPYPTGSVVRLSNGLVAQVCQQTPGLVFRPVVKLFSNGQELDLSKENNIVISRPARPVEMRQIAMEGGKSHASIAPAGRAAGNGKFSCFGDC